MIPLDHNHSSAVLASSPHADRHAALPWSSPPRDPRPSYPDSQEHAPAECSEQPVDADEAQEPPSLSPSAAPADAQQHTPLPEPSPRGTADARSPPPDSNSSLTPPPEAATPKPAAEAPSQPPNGLRWYGRARWSTGIGRGRQGIPSVHSSQRTSISPRDCTRRRECSGGCQGVVQTGNARDSGRASGREVARARARARARRVGHCMYCSAAEYIMFGSTRTVGG